MRSGSRTRRGHPLSSRHETRRCPRIPFPRPAREDRGRPDEAPVEPARPRARVLAGRGGAVPRDPEEPRGRLQVHREGQPRRRRDERHRGARPRQHRRARRQAGHGGQGATSSSSSPTSTCFDLEVGSEDPDDVIKFCQLLEPTVGGINLEDIRAPDCFYIEETLRRTMKVPGVPRRPARHGDHLRGRLLNAVELVGKSAGRDARRVLRRRGGGHLHGRALRAARRPARAHHDVRPCTASSTRGASRR